MAAYTTFDVNAKKIDIEDKAGSEFWLKHFQEVNTSVSTAQFAEPMLKTFSDENKKVVSVLCKHVICCSGAHHSRCRKVPRNEFRIQQIPQALWTFRPVHDECERCVTIIPRFLIAFRMFQAKKVFFKETVRKDGENEYTLVPWYHGYLEDSKKKIMENPDKYLVREPKEKNVWHMLTVEYSKTFVKDGKKVLARNKKHLLINRKWANPNISQPGTQTSPLRKNLYVWTARDGRKQGHPNIEVALKEMAKNRDPINSEMWTAVENQSLYQAASYDYD
eukprot:817959-Amorphochlora_amoeboformis.AAC.1